MWSRWIALVGLLVLPLPALADADSAWKAYCSHHYDRALNELRPLADAGDAKAQFTSRRSISTARPCRAAP